MTDAMMSLRALVEKAPDGAPIAACRDGNPARWLYEQTPHPGQRARPAYRPACEPRAGRRRPKVDQGALLELRRADGGARRRSRRGAPHDPAIMLGDKGFDSDPIRQDLHDRGAVPEIPTKCMRANQLRPWFASMAYVLLCALRRIGLAHTQFAEATCGTLRLALLKIGAQLHRSVRRIKIAMASAHPCQAEFALAHARLTAAATP